MPTHYYLDYRGRVTLLHLTEQEARKEEASATKILHRDFDRELVASADVLTIVLGIPLGQQHTGHGMRLASAMQRAGWERPASERVRIDGKQVRGYFRLLVETASSRPPRRTKSVSRRTAKAKKPLRRSVRDG